MELNSDGKIQLEETINESAINGNADTTANVSDSTFDDSKNGTQNSDKLDASGVEPTAAVLSIDDPENGEIFKNHLICNNINNNHIPNKPAAGVVVTTAPTATTESDINEPIQIALNKATVASSKNGDATIDEKSTAIAANNNTNAKANEANGDVVNKDNDTTKRLSNHSNTDAANSVGFFSPIHTYINTHIESHRPQTKHITWNMYAQCSYSHHIYPSCSYLVGVLHF